MWPQYWLGIGYTPRSSGDQGGKSSNSGAGPSTPTIIGLSVAAGIVTGEHLNDLQ
jgi:hypothetical protein